MEEPILNPSEDRFVVFPVQHQDLWELYKNHLGCFWTREEIDFSEDPAHWKRLNDSERHFVKHVLAFFAASDGIVSENIVARFCNDVQYPEARQFYGVQLMMECIHNETYSVMLDTYVTDPEEKLNLFKAIETVPAVKAKAEWARKWIGNGALENLPPRVQSYLRNNANSSRVVSDWLHEFRPSFAERLIAFAVVEGIFFSGSFCAIFWLNDRGLMPGLSTANQFIARDEGLHQTFACTLYRDHIVNKLDERRVHDIVREAVAIEKEFVTDALPVRLIGMNADSMASYIEFVADRLLEQLGVAPLFGTANPFDFMDMISLQGKTNFFEKRVSEYQKFQMEECDFAKEYEF